MHNPRLVKVVGNMRAPTTQREQPYRTVLRRWSVEHMESSIHLVWQPLML
jgi:hypothetical protein